MFEHVSIIGDGAMGTVLAILLCEKKIPVKIWGYAPDQLKQIELARENKKFLPGYKIPDAVNFDPDDRSIMTAADLIVSAVPCQYIRSVWTRLKANIPRDVPIVSVAGN